MESHAKLRSSSGWLAQIQLLLNDRGSWLWGFHISICSYNVDGGSTLSGKARVCVAPGLHALGYSEVRAGVCSHGSICGS